MAKTQINRKPCVAGAQVEIAEKAADLRVKDADPAGLSVPGTETQEEEGDNNKFKASRVRVQPETPAEGYLYRRTVP